MSSPRAPAPHSTPRPLASPLASRRPDQPVVRRAAVAIAALVLGAGACGKSEPSPAAAPSVAAPSGAAQPAPAPEPEAAGSAEEARPRRGLDDGAQPAALETAPPPLEGLFAADAMGALPASADLAVAIDLAALDGELVGPLVGLLRDGIGVGAGLVALSPVTREAAGLPKSGVIAAARFGDAGGRALVVPLADPKRFRELLDGGAGGALGEYQPAAEAGLALAGVYTGPGPGGGHVIVIGETQATFIEADDSDLEAVALLRAFKEGPRIGANEQFARAAALTSGGAVAAWVSTGVPELGGAAFGADAIPGGLAFTVAVAPGSDVIRRVLRTGGALPAEGLIGPETTFAMGLRLQPSELLRFAGALLGSDAETVDELKMAARELAGVDLEGDLIALLSGDLGLALEGGLDPERAATNEGEAAIVASLKGIATIGIKEPARVRALLAKAPSLEPLRGAGLAWDDAGVLSASIPGGSVRLTLAEGQLVATNDEGLAARASAAPQATSGLGDTLGAISRAGRAVGFLSLSGALLAPALSGMVRLEEAPWPPPPTFDDAPAAQKKLEGALNEAYEAAMTEWRASNEAARTTATQLAVAAGRVGVVLELKGDGIVGTGRWTLAPGEGLEAWFDKARSAQAGPQGEARATYESLREAFVRAGDEGEGDR